MHVLCYGSNVSVKESGHEKFNQGGTLSAERSHRRRGATIYRAGSFLSEVTVVIILDRKSVAFFLFTFG